MVSDSDQLVIKRAVNEIQARTRKWWLRHPGCVRDIAFVDKAEYQCSDVEICCGKIRESTNNKLSVGILICEGKTTKDRIWRLLEENPIQIDTDDGTAWIMRYADWELPDNLHFQKRIQSALIAASGMADTDLAALLKVKVANIKKWYSGYAPIPNKTIKEIVTRFIS